MNAPRYIQKELKAIDSLFFAVYNPYVESGMSYGRGRWQVRKWRGVHPKRHDLWDIESDVIMTLCKEEVTDEGLVDVGYEKIDRRVITAIGESNYWKANYKKKLQEIDWNNENLERKAKVELEYESRYMAKSIWRKMKEPTVFLNGKSWKI